MKVRKTYTFSTKTRELIEKLKEFKGVSRTKLLEDLVLKEAVKLGLED